MLALSPRELKLANTQEAQEQFTPEQGLQYLLRTERGQEHARLAQGAWGGLWMGGHRGRIVVPDGACNIFTKALSDFLHTIQHRVANFIFTGGR